MRSSRGRSTSSARLDVCAAVAGVWPAEDFRCGSCRSSAGNRRWPRTCARRSSPPAASCARWRAPATAAWSWSRRPQACSARRATPDYAAAKSAIGGGLLLSLKNEVVRVAPRARVNVVAPGWTLSPMTREALDEETLDRVTRTMALREVAAAEDIARQIVVLSSDELSGHVTARSSRSPAAWRVGCCTHS